MTKEKRNDWSRGKNGKECKYQERGKRDSTAQTHIRDRAYLPQPLAWSFAKLSATVCGVLASMDVSHDDIDECENLSMLTVQACQQHRLVVMYPNNTKSFPAATVPAVAKLGHRRGKRGTRSEERVETLVGHMSVSKRVGYGGVEAWWECCPQHVGRIKAGT